MRQINKRQIPPANVSPPDQERRSLQKAEEDFLSQCPTHEERLKHARAFFDALHKPALTVPLAQDQRGICIYCERTIRPDANGEPIGPVEHWRPLGHQPRWALNWANLFLSCPTKESCDGSKGGERLWKSDEDDLPWPWLAEAPYHTWLGIDHLGKLYVRTDASLDDDTRKGLTRAIDETLKLNSDALKAARRQIMDDERERLAKRSRHATREERTQRAAQLASQTPLPSFVSTRVAYLCHRLGKSAPTETTGAGG